MREERVTNPLADQLEPVEDRVILIGGSVFKIKEEPMLYILYALLLFTSSPANELFDFNKKSDIQNWIIYT